MQMIYNFLPPMCSTVFQKQSQQQKKDNHSKHIQVIEKGQRGQPLGEKGIDSPRKNQLKQVSNFENNHLEEGEDEECNKEKKKSLLGWGKTKTK
ncbi:hypothetical protein RFI_04992 [Reticulomyxa filosa]|uniref:Uncharacterized protein n=1 Tax=Reticulomyxa filosa TaxID=46433 RepID=X6P1V7_RETFI|nr:hypothetical protein RFI_04992 [Reticulomyxa filosa]|eukprot:ETO32123.1 hypothetical protein RFI_04992 [Reticulomyxa filosa]